jgi:hypothetical protein
MQTLTNKPVREKHLVHRHAVPTWLWLTVPIAVLAAAASVIGILVDDIYAKETANWAGQGFGQDIGNLIAYPTLLVLAYAATRGSLRAYLACIGVLAYSVYTFAIYVFDIHFGPLFLVHVAVFGLSIWALIGALASLEITVVKSAFGQRTPVRSTSALLIVIGCAFALLWLSEILPAMLDGTTPQSMIDAGLVTNPVHVLDLSVLLPAALMAGLLLRRGRAWGYVLAPVVLGALVFLSIGIIAAMTVLAVRGEGASLGVAGFLSVLTVLEMLAWVRFLRSIHPDGLAAVTRPTLARRGE